MKTRLAAVGLAFSVLLLAACTTWREHPVHNWKDATGGVGLEQTFWKQVKDRKWADLEQHMASNYVSMSPGKGRMDRAETLAHLQQLQLDEYALGDLQTELNGETFVVTYTLTMGGKVGGQPLPIGPVRMMTVWQKQQAGWMAIAHTVMGSGN